MKKLYVTPKIDIVRLSAEASLLAAVSGETGINQGQNDFGGSCAKENDGWVFEDYSDSEPSHDVLSDKF